MVNTPNHLINYLPAIYTEDPFLAQFLKAFEKVLLLTNDAMPLPKPRDDVKFQSQGLEEAIANIAVFFDPQQTPEEFLPWLASWTAFSLRADLTLKQQRDFIGKIIPLYRRRGTKENLQQLLEIFTLGKPTVEESGVAELQIGVNSTVGVDTYLGGGPPHFFRVTVVLPQLEAAKLERQLEITRGLIELEKPAHTYYELQPIFPSMQIKVHSTVGVDTLLGTVLKTKVS
jgi:phage tail-like protein